MNTAVAYTKEARLAAIQTAESVRETLKHMAESGVDLFAEGKPHHTAMADAMIAAVRVFTLGDTADADEIIRRALPTDNSMYVTARIIRNQRRADFEDEGRTVAYVSRKAAEFDQNLTALQAAKANGAQILNAAGLLQRAERDVIEAANDLVAAAKAAHKPWTRIFTD